MKDVQAAQNGGSMFENKTEQQAKDEILKMVAEYCDTYHNKKEYHEGDRIPYASRVYDHEEMCNLVDSALAFCLHPDVIQMNLKRSLQSILGYVTVLL